MELLPLSALQHLLYCERQCALIHLEREWAENYFTAEGRVLHERAHEGPDETRPGVRIARSLSVQSQTLGLFGYCDVVEFHADGRISVVEYKRGKPKEHRADEIQLCAQALCLEEMRQCTIPEGFLYYGKSRRRFEVPFDAALRTLTRETAERLHTMIASRQTPPPVFVAKKCSACSLLEICMPRLSKRPLASTWFKRRVSEMEIFC